MFRQLAETVQFLISREIQKRHIKTRSLIYRIKSFNSFLDKIRSKDAKDPFQEIMDIVGLRVVCLFRDDVKDVGDIVKEHFYIIEEDDKINSQDATIFGYMSLHYKAKLKDGQSGSYHEGMKDVPFEIQIRTIAQDARASISHYLGYKKESDIPAELRRDFNALSGLFYVADTHFAMLKQELTKYLVDKSSKE